MILIKLYSFDLSDKQLLELARKIGDFYGMKAFPLPLAADLERGRQVELILTHYNKPLAP